MKKLFRIFLLTALSALLLSSFAFATVSSGECGGFGEDYLDDLVYWQYDSETYTLTITGEGNMKNWKASVSKPWGSVTIKTVVIEEGVTSVGDYAFKDKTIETVSLPESLVTIGVSAFDGCRTLKTVHLGSNVAEIGKNAFSCVALEAFTVSPENPNYKAVDGALLSADGKKLILMPKGKEGTYTIPEGVTTICTGSFLGSKLSELWVPKSLAKVESEAFGYRNDMRKIYYPGSSDEWVKIKIDKHENDALSAGNKIYDSIPGVKPTGIVGGKSSFAHQSYWSIDLDTGVMTVSGTGQFGNLGAGTGTFAAWHKYLDMVTTLIIEEGITVIDTKTFRYFSTLERVELPASLTKILEYAFQGCNAIETVCFAGSEAHWQRGVAVSGSNIPLKDAPNFIYNYQRPAVTTADVTVRIPEGAEATVNGESKNGAEVTFALESGSYDLTVKKSGCLTHTVTGITVEGADIDLGSIELLQGDTNGDDMINIMDMAAFRQNFGKTGAAVTNPYTDTNGDGMVNIMDMGTFRRNFGKTAAKDCTYSYSTQASPV